MSKTGGGGQNGIPRNRTLGSPCLLGLKQLQVTPAPAGKISDYQFVFARRKKRPPVRPRGRRVRCISQRADNSVYCLLFRGLSAVCPAGLMRPRLHEGPWNPPRPIRAIFQAVVTVAAIDAIHRVDFAVSRWTRTPFQPAWLHQIKLSPGFGWGFLFPLPTARLCGKVRNGENHRFSYSVSRCGHRPVV